MKNYEEMAHDVFQRINEYDVRKKKQKKMIARTAAVVCPACIVAVAGFGIWQNGGFSPNDNMFTESLIVPKPENDITDAIIITTTSGEITLKTNNTTHTESVTSVSKNAVSSSYANNKTTTSNIKTSENNPVLTSDDIFNTETFNTSPTNNNNIIINTTVTTKKPDNHVNNTTDSQIVETSDNTSVTTVDTNAGVTDITSGEQVIITGENGTAQMIDSFNMNGFYYIEVCEANGSTLTINNLIMSNSERDVFTVKENKYLLLVKKSGGETVLFTVVGSIIVNDKIYFETQISSDNYTGGNYLGLAGDFEIISTPFNSYIGQDEKIFTVKENEQFILLKSSDGETRVFAVLD